jgi:tRNA nucleotidyltransferase (CCA-adding enzyme)
MGKLEMKKIIFGEPNAYHFVTFTSGEHSTDVIEDRHDIDIEVMIPSFTKIEEIEKIGLAKARRFVKELASSFPKE